MCKHSGLEIRRGWSLMNVCVKINCTTTSRYGGKTLAKLLKPPTSKWRKPKQLLMMMAVAVGKQKEMSG